MAVGLVANPQRSGGMFARSVRVMPGFTVYPHTAIADCCCYSPSRTFCDTREDRNALIAKRYRHSPERKPVCIIVCAIERIDYPSPWPFTIEVLCFFWNHSVVRETFP